jgi:hypothetical protein
VSLQRRRVPLLAAGVVSMAAGAWLGLARIGWAVPLPRPDQLIAHGPIMVCGFLGTLISLERAVGLGARWAYTAPIAAAAGAVLLDIGQVGSPAAASITIASAIVVAIFVVIFRRDPSLFALTMGAGALAWLVGNVLWLAGFAIYRIVLWWVAFLVLTIAGERLELNRVLRPTPLVRAAFVAAAALVCAGTIVSMRVETAGVRLAGAGWLATAAWLARNDVARRTVVQRGLTRFMAITLLGGYAWLAAGGAVAVLAAPATPGVLYDAMLHAVFVGFVLSMVFAHAPVIFPAILGVPLRYRSVFYAHVALLHGSLALRIAGDLVEDLARWRVWGGLLNAVCLLLFLVNTVSAIAFRTVRAQRADLRVRGLS